ncbi:MAG: Na+/H+ antiporter subunit E [Gemmatimonadota bacterium]|nr:Na+/H+ antiporter subunit E [Gemmatimonadota bacterium]MDH5759933.1 Na+/H+ antiporter subunit E [Gemmatimonadota bacterium]
MRALGLGVILFGFWLALSGHYTPLLLSLGVGSTVLVVYLATRMDVVDHEGIPLHIGGRFWVYFPWLLKEIFVANVHVARIILSPGLPIHPLLVHYRSSQKTDLGRAIYANSITLTPGTITMSVDGQDLEIHSLTWVDVDGREEDEMDRRVTWVEQGA